MCDALPDFEGAVGTGAAHDPLNGYGITKASEATTVIAIFALLSSVVGDVFS